MPIFYYGIHPTILLAMAIAIAIVSLWFFFSKLYSNRIKNWNGYILIASICSVAFLLHASRDLREPITDSQAKLLESYYQTSLEYGQLGQDFRNTLEQLAEDNSVLVTTDLSHIGTKIYTTYITKKDWNDLAKVYNQSNLPK